MNKPTTHYVLADVRLLDESSQRELYAYRKLGSVKEFRRLKQQEFRRRETRERLHQIINTLLAGALLAACTTIIMTLLVLLA